VIAAIRELMATTHCLNARLCVAYNVWRFGKAKSDLAAALAALDACEANARISTHTEAPPIPRSLVKRPTGARQLSDCPLSKEDK